MKIRLFAPLYAWTLRYASKPGASWFLAFLATIESIFFPIPCDVLLAPMVIAKPQSTWKYAAITTVFSVLGGVIGYFLGIYIYDLILPLIDKFHYADEVTQLTIWYQTYGLVILFLAGFSPLPYKLFTITAGVLSTALIPFILISLIGRGLRFFLVAAVVKWLGHRFGDQIQQYIERLGWTIVLLVAAFILYKTVS